MNLAFVGQRTRASVVKIFDKRIDESSSHLLVDSRTRSNIIARNFSPDYSISMAFRAFYRGRGETRRDIFNSND